MANIKTYNHGLPWEDEHGIAQGYCVNGTIYISGQFSHDIQGTFVGEGDIEVQTRQTLENLDRVLAGFGATRSNIAEMEIFLSNPQELKNASVFSRSMWATIDQPVPSLVCRVWHFLIS
ncbi:putative aminoacrylate peracid reductase RutC [Anaerotignum neopropionicum]|uniref:Putative aminoacrylate peracid reductase RutC n=1 Tax=Anaerotignum neopropionicum TaxID=36847 RepID=A0A136WGR7_9FIRM|nr:RidA family protein [Anaerotignum neopropionicum]KXL53756.1 putative aminoacrylate peracid reductase RutC [Anaerotignum neopropionicum]